MSITLLPGLAPPPLGESATPASAPVPSHSAGAGAERDIMEQYREAFDELFGAGHQQRMWRRAHEAAKEASLTDDFPLSQSSKADAWKADR